MKKSSCIFEIIYSYIREEKTKLTIRELCKLAGVSRSGYYAWINSAPVRAIHEEKDRQDFSIILEAFVTCKYEKGARWIYMYLIHMDPQL